MHVPRMHRSVGTDWMADGDWNLEPYCKLAIWTRHDSREAHTPKSAVLRVLFEQLMAHVKLFVQTSNGLG